MLVGLVVQVTASPAGFCEPRPLSERFLVVAQSGAMSKIFTVRPDGKDWQRLTDQFGSEADACASAVRGEVFFRSLIDKDWEIACWNLERRETRRLTNSAGLDRQPQPSPDGKQLAFTSDRQGSDEIFVLDLENPQAEPTRLTWDQGNNSSPNWSPDGQFLVFASRRNGQSDLYQRELATGKETRLTASDEDEVDPRWSPDGSRILFQTVEGRYREGRLGILELSSGQRTMLGHLGGSLHQASWSPRGDSIVYLDYRSGRQPSSPALTRYSLVDQSVATLEVIRRGLIPWHWSYLQVQWITYPIW